MAINTSIVSLPSTMRALQILSPSNLQPTKLPLPTLTGPNDILIRLLATAINPSDALNASGGFPYTTYPRVPGRDFSGVVVAPPTHRLTGRVVLGTSGAEMSFVRDGAHAEYVVVGEEDVAILPTKGVDMEGSKTGRASEMIMTPAQAASLGVPWTTASLCLKRAAASPGETVLVLGSAGAVGRAAVQIARARGCKVLCAARREDADVNLLEDPQLSGVSELTEGKGVNVIVDTVGSPALMRAAIAVLAVRGRIAFIASPRGEGLSTEMSFDMKELYRQEKSIVGCNSLKYSAKEMGEMLREVVKGFQDGIYQPTPEKELVLIKLDDALEGYKKIKERKGEKFVIVFDQKL